MNSNKIELRESNIYHLKKLNYIFLIITKNSLLILNSAKKYAFLSDKFDSNDPGNRLDYMDEWFFFHCKSIFVQSISSFLSFCP